MIRYASAFIALALLSACESEPEPVASGANAEGDVLEGSISDAMLPLDTVTSKAPPAAGESSNDDENGDEGDDGEE